jgi:lipid-A-disaccharide synthase
MNNNILIIAGEASADMHGAKVVAEIRRQHPEARLFGVGGQAMRAEGFDAIIQAEKIAVVGLTEVLLALPRLWGYFRRLIKVAKQRQPRVAVLIDLPDFNLRLAKHLKRLGIPVVYYISPQLWAWRQKRVDQIRQLVDQMLVILPFEKSFYDQHHINAEFVGHPLIDVLPAQPDQLAARQRLGLRDTVTVALLPGSRHKEISRHLPLMLRGLQILQTKFPSLQGVIPVASTVARVDIEYLIRQSSATATVIDGQATDVLSASDAAIVCSGTATLQAALLLRPMVVVYRVSWLSYQIFRRLIRVAHIGLVNLIAQKRLCPELVQSDFTPERTAFEVERLLVTSKQIQTELALIRKTLGDGQVASRVATIVCAYLK